jgi:hypothetical protein
MAAKPFRLRAKADFCAIGQRGGPHGPPRSFRAKFARQHGWQRGFAASSSRCNIVATVIDIGLGFCLN